jgi:hypothetical protein
MQLAASHQAAGDVGRLQRRGTLVRITLLQSGKAFDPKATKMLTSAI